MIGFGGQKVRGEEFSNPASKSKGPPGKERRKPGLAGLPRHARIIAEPKPLLSVFCSVGIQDGYPVKAEWSTKVLGHPTEISMQIHGFSLLVLLAMVFF